MPVKPFFLTISKHILSHIPGESYTQAKMTTQNTFYCQTFIIITDVYSWHAQIWFTQIVKCIFKEIKDIKRKENNFEWVEIDI